MLPFLLLSWLLSAWVAGAQIVQTVIVTETVFTACECTQSQLASSLAGLPLPIPSSVSGPNPGTMSVLQASATAAAASSPAVVPTISHTTGLSGPEPTAVTVSGTLPSLSVLSSPDTVSGLGPMPSLLSSFISDTLTVSPASIASALSLSGGLGPLLSSAASLSLATPTPIASPASVASAVSLSDGLGPLLSSATAASTATVPSTLTDSAENPIPSAASISSISGSEAPASSSSAKLSYSSPTSGASLGTASEILTTYSTVTLNDVHLTGVTILAPRSPTSCFALPTPATAMDLVAVAVTPMDDVDISHPLLMAFGENATTPQYVGAMANGEPYVLDMSPDNSITGQLGLQIPGQNALVFDGSGMSLFTGNCSSISQVTVDNFWDQISSMATVPAPPLTSMQLDKRAGLNTTNFTVQVSFDSYLNTPFFSPNLTFGNTLCDLQLNTLGNNVDNITWSCIYPPPEGGAKACGERLATWLNGMSLPSSSPHNSTEVLATISPFLDGAGSALLALFPVSDPALNLGLTFMQKINAAAKQAVGEVGTAACDVLHIFDSDELVLQDHGPLGEKTLGSFIQIPPPSMAINLAASATASITALPPRVLNPTDDLLSQIATIFPSLLGPFLSWISALPTPSFPLLSGIFGVETGAITGAPMLTAPLAAITSTATLPTPEIAQIQAPTVTVTHVLGDGWFTPSTYIVGTGTSTPPEPPTSTVDAPAAIVSAYGASAGYPSNIIDEVVGRLAAMGAGNAGVRQNHHWDWPSPPSESGERTITTQTSSGSDGHFVMVTTTVTVFSDRLM